MDKLLFKNTLRDVEVAYNRLKSFVYYDNTLVELRVKISEYESSELEKKLKKLAASLIDYSAGITDYVGGEIEKIGYYVKPKTFTQNTKDNKYKFDYITNINKKDKYVVDKFIYFIDCSVELHIISAIWLDKFGKLLDKSLDECCYANRLVGGADYSRRMFRPYYINYQSWRDRGVECAIEKHEASKDVIIASLDIKNYYDSIDYDIDAYSNISKEYSHINTILSKIHKAYSKVRHVDKKILPIGLLSSSILANTYLNEFDKKIKNDLKPDYYGRYVDDILLVFGKNKIKSFEDEFDKLFIGSNFLIKKDGCFTFVVGDNALQFQEHKIKIYCFGAKDSAAILREFKNKIRESSSEFRFLPDEEKIFSEFNAKSYKINYSDTINKLRSIEAFENNKFGASRHLSNIIYALKYVNDVDDENRLALRDQILDFFAGQRSLELYQLWEKALAVFVLANDIEGFTNFVYKTIAEINKIQNKIKGKLIAGLVSHLKYSIAMALALDYRFYEKQASTVEKNNSNSYIYKSAKINIDISSVNKISRNLIKSNMFRHGYVFFPLLNICSQKSTFDLRNPVVPDNTSWILNKRKIKYYPRFIHFHELCIFYNLRSYHSASVLPKLSIIFNNFKRYNSLSSIYLKEYYPKQQKYNDYTTITVNNYAFGKGCFANPNVTIINKRVKFHDSLKNLLGTPELSLDRLLKLNAVLNKSIKECSNYVIFPEISVPIQWLPHFTEFSRRNNIAVIVGLEHCTNAKKEAFNFSAVILPFRNKNFTNAYPDLRLKIDYAPGEIKVLNDCGFSVPERAKHEKIHLFTWSRHVFSVFNCYEVSDIYKRSFFRGLVDFVTIIEYNKDVEYFSNIVKSYTRDIHAYVIQVNCSNFGDSRISQPSKSHLIDIAKIQGGNGYIALTENLDIYSLRKFQMLPISQQKGTDNQQNKEDEKFKVIPPNFKISNFRKLNE